MAYCTATECKTYLGITTATDDALLATLIAAAQAYIDAKLGFSFEASADTEHTFDAVADVDGYALTFDAWCCDIASVTNGDGTTVTSSQYVTEPRNSTPFYAIRLKSSASVSWTYSTDPEDAITVDGKWGWSETAGDDIRQACIRLVAWLYRQKDTSADADRPLLTGDGNIIMPSAFPADVMTYLRPYRRIS